MQKPSIRTGVLGECQPRLRRTGDCTNLNESEVVELQTVAEELSDPIRMRNACDAKRNETNPTIEDHAKKRKRYTGRALVEMENPKQAEQIVRDMGNLPFMMSGMPRPIRARAADPEMFDDRPRKPGKRITFRWLDQQDPDFQVAKKLKDLTRKNAAEASFIMERQVGEEEKLANQQWKTLKANYKKYELIDGVLGDGTALRLAERYNTRIFDDK